jgi:hypothetical protein
MRTSIFCISAASLLLFSCVVSSALAQNRLVNMIPNNRSGETNQDAEPTITVDPNNFSRLAGSAFTWDNLTGSAMVTATAPIYVSTNGGIIWTLAFIVPSAIGAAFPTGDITLSFSSTLNHVKGRRTTSWLYGGTLSSAAVGRPMTVLRTPNPFSPALMTTLDTHSGYVDQPHTLSKTSAGEDKLYVGFNNGYYCTAPNGRSATLDVSQDTKLATPAFTLDVIEARNTGCQDGYAQVPAPHSDGTVYAAFIHDTGAPRLAVVRDDNWGIGTAPFTALTDSSDSVAGRFVTTGLSLPSGIMGQNRLGASNVSIAVDPANSNRVYVAWGDSNGASSETIHVRRSINRGVDWSDDLMSVTNAMNPEIAIGEYGVVGVLYQAVVSGNWETRLAKSNDLDASTFVTPGILLAKQSSTTPASTYWPYIGDYASLTAAGPVFVGMFSASNYPDKGNFMSGIKFQREVDWNVHKLYADAAHTTEVAPSIDPFFFEIRTSVCDRSAKFCDICHIAPEVCYPIFDPWWWQKCPQCGIEIFINPGDPIERVVVFDSNGKQVGNMQRLREPMVEKGVTYTYRIRLKPEKGVGYVLKAVPASGAKVKGSFQPSYIVKTIGSSPEAR